MLYRFSLLLFLACGRVGFEGLEPALIDAPANEGELPDDAGQVASTVHVTVSPTGECPMVAWGGDSIGVVWREGSFTGAADVHFARYDLTGALVQGPLTIATALENVGCSAIAWTGTAFLLAIPYGQLNRLEIDTARVSSAGATSLTNVVNDSGDSDQPRLAVRGAQVVLAWHDQTGTNYNVLARPLSVDGVPTAAAFTVSGISSMNGPPSLAVTATGFVVAYDADGPPVIRELAADGSLAGPERAITPTSDATGHVAAVEIGDHLVLAWAMFASDVFTTAAVTPATGDVSAGPFTFSAASNSRNHVLLPRPGGAALLFVGAMNGTKLQLGYLDANGQLATSYTVRGGTSTATPSLAFTGTHYIAAISGSSGAFVSIFPAP